MNSTHWKPAMSLDLLQRFVATPAPMNLLTFLSDVCHAQHDQFSRELELANLRALAESVAVAVVHEVNPTEGAT
jgi:hypothetical protein